MTAQISFAEPDWDITVYPTSTVAYGNVTIDGKPAEAGDIVYAFVYQECRGKQPVKEWEGKAIITMNIQGLDDHEPVFFKVWDADADSVYEVSFTTFTKPNKDLGYPPDLLPINALTKGITLFFPPETLEMHPYEVRQLDIAYYCNTSDQIKDVRIFGNENLEVVPENLIINIAAPTVWVGEEEIEIELLDEKDKVIEIANILIIVKYN